MFCIVFCVFCMLRLLLCRCFQKSHGNNIPIYTFGEFPRDGHPFNRSAPTLYLHSITHITTLGDMELIRWPYLTVRRIETLIPPGTLVRLVWARRVHSPHCSWTRLWSVHSTHRVERLYAVHSCKYRDPTVHSTN